MRGGQVISEDVVAEISVIGQQEEILADSIGEKGMIIRTSQSDLLGHGFDHMPPSAQPFDYAMLETLVR